MTVPIVVINWNGFEDTCECISSLLMMREVDYVIYLIDNDSDNFEGIRLRDKYEDNPQIKVELNTSNLGFTRGTNKILAKLLKEDYDFIALLNNDTVVDPFWLKSALHSIAQHRADMISSKMINYYDRSIMDNAGHYMLNTAEILPRGHARPIEEYDRLQTNLGACGGAAIYSAEMFRQIGLFDEFFDTGYEDAEFGIRANILGYKTIYEPSAKVFHKVSRSINKVRDEDYIIKIQRNIFYTYLKLLPKYYILFNSIFIFIKYLFLFIGSMLSLNFRVIRIHYKTIRSFITKDFNIAIRRRRELRANFSITGMNHTLEKINFFLKTDIRRFLNLLRKRPNTTI